MKMKLFYLFFSNLIKSREIIPFIIALLLYIPVYIFCIDPNGLRNVYLFISSLLWVDVFILLPFFISTWFICNLPGFWWRKKLFESYLYLIEEAEHYQKITLFKLIYPLIFLEIFYVLFTIMLKTSNLYFITKYPGCFQLISFIIAISFLVSMSSFLLKYPFYCLKSFYFPKKLKNLNVTISLSIAHITILLVNSFLKSNYSCFLNKIANNSESMTLLFTTLCSLIIVGASCYSIQHKKLSVAITTNVSIFILISLSIIDISLCLPLFLQYWRQ